MHILRVEHSVRDYGAWKAVFDRDPAQREESGVRAYRIQRGSDDLDYVMIDLEFSDAAAAEAMLGKLRGVWAQAEGSIMDNVKARVCEVVESHTY